MVNPVVTEETYVYSRDIGNQGFGTGEKDWFVTGAKITRRITDKVTYNFDAPNGANWTLDQLSELADWLSDFVDDEQSEDGGGVSNGHVIIDLTDAAKKLLQVKKNG